MYTVTINEGLIQAALGRAKPVDLEDIRTVIEAYRTCAATAERLVRNRSMETQRKQVLECAVYCEEKLSAYVAAGQLPALHYPKAGVQCGHMVLSMEW